MEQIDLTENVSTKADIQRLLYAKSDRVILLDNLKGRSGVWKKFNIIQLDGIKTDNACCSSCKKVFNLTSNGKSIGTSALNNHKCLGIQHTQMTIQNSLKKDISVDAKRNLNKSLVLGLCEDLVPFKSIHNKGFLRIAQEFIKIGSLFGEQNAANLLFDRTNLKRTYLVQVYNELRLKVFENLKIINNCAFTTDIWTQKHTNNSYITITVQYIDKNYKFINITLSTFMITEKKKDNLKRYIKSALDNFFHDTDDIISKSYFVTDNGSNIKKIFSNWIGCSCHNLNLVIQNTFNGNFLQDIPTIQSTLLASKELVRFFKKSNNSNKLDTSLKQEIPTRWNTILIMLLSIQSNWDNIKSVLKDLKKEEKLYLIRKDIIDIIISILLPFKICSEDLSSSTRPSIVKVAKWKYELLDHLGKNLIIHNNNLDVKKLIEKLIYYIEEKFTILPIHFVAAFFDPKYY